ncbi:MAG: M23 family metallopeptidase [Myxococcota bacterium]
MEHYSLIVMTGETSPIRRIDVRRCVLRRALWAAGVAGFVLIAGLADYVRLRIDNRELAGLRIETGRQHEQIDAFDTKLSMVEATLERLREFERKVRIIANLPGSAGTGGEGVAEARRLERGDLEVGIEADFAPAAEGSVPAPATREFGPQLPPASAGPSRSTSEAARVGRLYRDAERLGLIANARELDLAELVQALEGKHRKLSSTPSIWPTRGWLTSRFGSRISPFTGARQFHGGIDVAGKRGTPIVAPARGRVTFAGSKGALGNTVIVDHGYGVRTVYGHNEELFVKAGEDIDRGQRIASLGNTGRSTGPHLHYAVEVQRKAVNPLDYIFD